MIHRFIINRTPRSLDLWFLRTTAENSFVTERNNDNNNNNNVHLLMNISRIIPMKFHYNRIKNNIFTFHGYNVNGRHFENFKRWMHNYTRQGLFLWSYITIRSNKIFLTFMVIIGTVVIFKMPNHKCTYKHPKDHFCDVSLQSNQNCKLSWLPWPQWPCVTISFQKMIIIINGGITIGL